MIADVYAQLLISILYWISIGYYIAISIVLLGLIASYLWEMKRDL